MQTHFTTSPHRNPRKRIPLEQRFWSKVDYSGRRDDCWPWVGARLPNGYGRFGIDTHQAVLAHRLAYRLAIGPILPDMYICHHCDNPACCNPAHLFMATPTDNVADCRRKGRICSGERHGSRTRPGCMARGDANGARLYPERMRRGTQSHLAKLTELSVQEIRKSLAIGLSRKTIAAQYEVCPETIGYIIRGQTWRHVL